MIPPAFQEFPIHLSGGRRGVLWMPSPENEADLALIEQQLTNAIWIARNVFLPTIETERATDTPSRTAEWEDGER